MKLKKLGQGAPHGSPASHGHRIPRVRFHPEAQIVAVERPARSASWPKYVYTLCLYGFWRQRHTFVLTDRRVILGKGILKRTERSIPIERIDDAIYTRNGVFAYSE